MKKYLCLCLVIVMLFLITSCKSKDAKYVDELILSIGTVTLDSEQTIATAVDSYHSLSEEDKATIENYEILQQSQAEFLHVLIASLEESSVADMEGLLKAQNYYDYWALEQVEPELQNRLDQLSSQYTKLETLEALRTFIRENGNAVTEGGVNGSTIKHWNYNGLILNLGGRIEINYNEQITDEYGKHIARDDDDYASTKITFYLDSDGISLRFYSCYTQREYLNNESYFYAQGFMDDILYETYTIDGELPNIHTYSSDETNMRFRYAPFHDDEEFGHYIREVIHNGIYDLLLDLKDVLGEDIVKLGFSSDVIAVIA